jgi:hypothetical protein
MGEPGAASTSLLATSLGLSISSFAGALTKRRQAADRNTNPMAKDEARKASCFTSAKWSSVEPVVVAMVRLQRWGRGMRKVSFVA